MSGGWQVDYVNSCPVACLGKVMPPNAKMVASRMVMRKLGVSGLVEVSTRSIHGI